MQDVQDFLCTPFKEYKTDCTSIAHFYFLQHKRVQEGHAFNVEFNGIHKHLVQPRMIVQGQLLNQTIAAIMDIVHWAMRDYRALMVQRSKKGLPRNKKVCSPTVPVPCF